MKTIYRLLPIAFFSFFTLPFQAYANSILVDSSTSGICNVYIEIINFSVALVIVSMIFLILSKLSNGLKLTWIYFFLAAILFVVLHLIGLLQAFNIVDLSSIVCIIELVMLVLLLLAVMTFRKFTHTIIETKSFTQEIKGKD